MQLDANKVRCLGLDFAPDLSFRLLQQPRPCLRHKSGDRRGGCSEADAGSGNAHHAPRRLRSVSRVYLLLKHLKSALQLTLPPPLLKTTNAHHDARHSHHSWPPPYHRLHWLQPGERRGEYLVPTQRSHIQLDEKIGRQFFEACRDVGFAYLTNTGITDDDVNTIFDWSRRFHSLPDEAKAKCKILPRTAKTPRCG